ncbi:Arm DNA-binding domain-containing protein [Yeosuana sp. MJ-SS3]|uniref:Arm DNA-binding domain-containing protein n=1 Tax=Gilvirhabdus luticola TaxID=3079858 RepID=A0ABU3U2B2_9FLAO|nr:Arm DNA-binding domain-containing protein [Yeosuana sp. MJ-SS3]MDU8884544.1 Arm DNA-binding domain-containing protein [Yeosuana sp. MJ-SS3]
MKLNILYIVNKHKMNKKGLCPITCRLTLEKRKKHFATGLFINPKHWNSKQQYVEPPEPDAEIINTQLSLIKTKINKAFLMLQVQENSFTVEDIYKTYKGEKIEKEYNVIEYFECYLKRLKTLIGIDIKQVTWELAKDIPYLKSSIPLKK